MADTFVISCRNIRRGRFGAEPDRIRYLRVPKDADDILPKHESSSKKRWRNGVITSANREIDPLSDSCGDVLVFVHGYNNDTDVVLWRTRQLPADLNAVGWKGRVIAFDWSSDNSTLNYLEDRDDASSVAIHLAREAVALLVDCQFPQDHDDEPCKMNVHLLGHSTGAYVIMEAFADAARKGEFFKKPWRIAQVAFIGGDVSRNSLSMQSDWSGPMYSRIMRLTNYSCGFDKALAVSNAKRLGTSPRAGRVGLPDGSHHKAVNVDCSDYFQGKDPQQSVYRGSFTHSWHIGDDAFTLDLALTLEGEIDRHAIPTRRATNQGLALRGDAARPQFQDRW